MSMFNRKITLTPDERKQLEKIVNGKKDTADMILRANILLMSDSACGEKKSDRALADKLQTTPSLVKFVRRTFLNRGLTQALQRDKMTPTNSRGFYF